MRRKRRGEVHESAQRVVEHLEARTLLANTFYVDANAPGITQDGASWGTAYKDLQAALSKAGSADTVRVADGTYKPTATTNRAISFRIISNLYGGYAGYGAPDPDAHSTTLYPTVLSGEIGDPSVTTDNSDHVVDLSSTFGATIVDGITVTGGYNASGGGGIYVSGSGFTPAPIIQNCIITGNRSSYEGGGCYVQNGSATLTNCTFTGNTARDGGGFATTYNTTTDATNSVITNCTFTGNSSTSDGGAASAFAKLTVTNCQFTSNSSSSGGAVFGIGAAVKISQCSFTSNSATGGGAIELANTYTTTEPTLTDCTFTQNSGSSGGACNMDSSSPTFTRCTFANNSATSAGGAVYSLRGNPVFTSCMFRANSAQSYGGAMYLPNVYGPYTVKVINSALVANSATNGGAMAQDYYTTLQLTNCSVVANTASLVSGKGPAIYVGINSTLSATNSIFWANKGAFPSAIDSSASNTSVSVSYSDVETANPRFVDGDGADNVYGTADDNLRPLSVSAVVDAGDNTAPGLSGISTDLSGAARFRDILSAPDNGNGSAPIVDMGAYEAVPSFFADTGGPYKVLAGNTITLLGAGDSDQPGPISYAWDLDGDGQFNDSNVASPAFGAAGKSPGQVINIALRVTDSANRTVTSNSTITIVPSVIYVDDSATGNNTGLSWNNAYTSLQSALSLAIAGAEIHVAQGNYTPTSGNDRTASFALVNAVALIGGYAGVGSANPDSRNVGSNITYLSGDIGAQQYYADDSYHVVTGLNVDFTTVVDGFTITRGAATASANPTWNGGGMYLDHSNPVIRNCTISNNTASEEGAGLFNIASSPALSNCTFTGNSGAYEGGGMSNENSSPTVTGCTFNGNSVTAFGGGINNNNSPAIAIANCTFSDNVAGSGGGIYNYATPLSVTDSLFVRNQGNSVGFGAGGMDISFSVGVSILRCRFVSNSADAGGGMINISSSPRIADCSFVDNFATRAGGGGIYNSSGSPQILDCTFTSNSAAVNGSVGGGGAIYSTNASSSPQIKNCILWGDSSPLGSELLLASGTFSVTYSDVQAGWTGTGNINTDPQFFRSAGPGADGLFATADDDAGDIRLRITSPCIDAGNSSLVPGDVTTDLAGNPRIVNVPGVRDPGANVDMGAMEYLLPFAATAGAFRVDMAKPSINITLNGDLDPATLSPGDLAVKLPNSGVVVNVSTSTSYDPATRTATWSLNTPLPDGNYQATIAANALADSRGDLLGSAFTVNFFFVNGDVNHDATVNSADFVAMAQNFLKTGATLAQGDFNLDGVVNALDFNILATQFGKTLAVSSVELSGAPEIRSLFGDQAIGR